MLATDWIIEINKNTIQDMGFTLFFTIIYLYSAYAGTFKDPTQELLLATYLKADRIDLKADEILKNENKIIKNNQEILNILKNNV
jgi:hypothetical protein